MATMALDTLSVSRRLQAAGFSSSQADAVTSIVNEAADPATRELVTRKDLQIELAPMRADIGLLKWMAGANLTLSVGILLKIFLH